MYQNLIFGLFTRSSILVFPKTGTISYNLSAGRLRLTVEANFVPGKT